MWLVLGYLAFVALETVLVARAILRRPASGTSRSTPDAIPVSTGFPELDAALEQYRICPSIMQRAEVEFQAEYAEGALTSCLFD